MAQDLSILVCGRTSPGPEFAEVMRHLRRSINYMLSQLLWLRRQNDRRTAALGPFLGRSLLELTVTALLGRLDPFRLLVVREMQLQSDSDPGVRWSAAVQWAGDVIAA